MSSSSLAPVEVVKAFMAAMEKMDYDEALKYVSHDCAYTNGPIGTTSGPAGVRMMLEPFFSMMSENVFVIIRELAAGPTVFLERLDRHRLPTGWIELPVTGVFEVHNGQITVWNEYFDAATIQKQLPAAS